MDAEHNVCQAGCKLNSQKSSLIFFFLHTLGNDLWALQLLLIRRSDTVFQRVAPVLRVLLGHSAVSIVRI